MRVDVEERLAVGDYADLDDADLTEAERAMVRAAADDYPAVAASSFEQVLGAS